MRFFAQGDIVSALFPYEENPSIRKRRPCLILGEGENLLLAAKITTTELRAAWGYHLNQGAEDMISGELPFESWINLNRREWIPYEDIMSFIGALTPSVVDDILLRLRRIMFIGRKYNEWDN